MAENEFKIDTYRVGDDGDIKPKLRAWLKSHYQCEDVIINSLSQPETGGMSASSLMMEIEAVTGAKSQAYSIVVRCAPNKPSFYKADVMEWGRAFQLVGETGLIPSPRVHVIEPDKSVLGSPFILMDRVAGRVPPDHPPYMLSGWVKDELTPDQRRAMWTNALKVTSDIHDLDWRAMGLDFLSKRQGGSTEVQGDLDHYFAFLEWGLNGRKPTALMRDIKAWLSENVPQSESVGLCWGDARTGNIVFDAERVAGVLDWEMVSLGDPAKDIGWWIFSDMIFQNMLGIDPPEGCLFGQELADTYESISGRTLEDLEFYKIFGGLRVLAIYTRTNGLQQEAGVDIPDSMSLENAPMNGAIRSLLESTG